MRRIVYSLFLLAVLAGFTCNQSVAQVKMIPTPAPERPAGQVDVLNLSCDLSRQYVLRISVWVCVEAEPFIVLLSWKG